MNFDKLNQTLRDEAIRLDLCEKWQKTIWNRNLSQEELIDIYFKGLDFAIEHHYPSNEFIKDNFDKDLLRKKGVLVDDKYSLLNQRFAILLGNSESTMRYNGTTLAQVYVRDTSKARIVAKGRAHVIVEVYDNAKVDTEIDDTATVMVIRN